MAGIYSPNSENSTLETEKPEEVSCSRAPVVTASRVRGQLTRSSVHALYISDWSKRFRSRADAKIVTAVDFDHLHGFQGLQLLMVSCRSVPITLSFLACCCCPSGATTITGFFNITSVTSFSPQSPLSPCMLGRLLVANLIFLFLVVEQKRRTFDAFAPVIIITIIPFLPVLQAYMSNLYQQCEAQSLQQLQPKSTSDCVWWNPSLQYARMAGYRNYDLTSSHSLSLPSNISTKWSGIWRNPHTQKSHHPELSASTAHKLRLSLKGAAGQGQPGFAQEYIWCLDFG